MILQILDANYVYDDKNAPIIQLFGRTKKGRRVVRKVTGFRPYFYAETMNPDTKRDLEGMGLKVEEVDRFRPIGYQEVPTKMLKIIATDPKDVRILRERVYGNGVKAVYETDILFKNRFLIDKKLGGMHWVYMPEGETVPANELIPLKMEENAQLHIMSFDIECLPNKGAMPKPDTSPAILISMAFSHDYHGQNDLVLVGKKIKCDRKDTIRCKNEKEMIEKFVEVISEYDPDVIAGYNSNEFDFTYLQERAKILKIAVPWYAKKIITTTNVNMTGRIIIDLLSVIRNSTEAKYHLKQYTLRNVAKELLGIEKYDMDPKEIESIWEGEGTPLKDFIRYARRDAYLALHLLTDLKILDKYVAMSRASGALMQDIINGGQSGMVESLLLRRFREHGRVVSPKPDDELQEERYTAGEGLKGAEVLIPKKGLIEKIVTLDYKSLYPTIMMAHNICYSTLAPENFKGPVIVSPVGGRFVPIDIEKGIVPEILAELLETRMQTKKLMKTLPDGPEKDFLDAKQYATKILLNSFYGYSGYARARLYNLDVANAVTSFGRENILKTRDTINNMESLQVAYGDTDSVLIQINKEDLSVQEAETIGKEVAKIVSKELPAPMELVFESFARRGIFLAKKRYALWLVEANGKEKIKVRGIETVRRDWCNLTSKTITKCLELILRDGKVEEAIETAATTIKQVQNNEIPIEDLVMTRRYTKTTGSYKNIQPHITVIEKIKSRKGDVPNIGDRVPFVIVKGKKKDLFVDRAENPTYVTKYGIKLDTEYYVKKQLLPPMLRIFETFGVTMETLVRKGDKTKQKSLMEW